ncbi:MAG: type ISP restriction/modification enzyme [Ilumatobacteraceae bacterium]
MCAQTLVYGALTSRVTDPVAFGASPTLSSIPLANPFLSAFFEEVHDHAVQLDGEDHLEQLVADLKVSNVEAILDKFGATEKGGDPVIHFYEDFLAAYDPEMKIQVGAFYTPQAAVKHMVGMVDAVLKERLGLPLGVADPATWGEVASRLGLNLPGVVDPTSPFVSMLDPATGTGTFLVEWIRRARDSYVEANGPTGWPQHARGVVLPSLHALELMLAPYAIAHLKTALELHEADVDGADLAIYLTDTLQRGGSGQLSIEPDPISVEGERADHVKRTVRSTIAIGNPPYDRVAQGAGSGGWITDRSGGRSPFDDILDPAREHTIFSHHASLYNKFVYFWRWTLWKAFEDRPGLPGVVSLITPSSWLTGPGFLGLRQLVRELGDEIWVTDLGGDNRGANKEPNIFDIETPVAIVTVARFGAGDKSTPAAARYRRVGGTRAEKLQWLDGSAGSLSDDEWTDLSSGWHGRLEPVSGGSGWQAHPALIDLFPLQQPGRMINRTWPVSPSAAVLDARWRKLLASTDLSERAEWFVTPPTGRNIHTRVADLKPISELPPGSPRQGIARYGFRSFDRQFILEDPRLMALDRPTLTASLSDKQVFLTSFITTGLGVGPAATVTIAVPDKHHFRGSFGGKDVIPLYRDAQGTPNADPQLLETIGDLQGSGAPVSAEALFAYSYAVLAGADYTQRFAEELKTPGPRVPLTADAQLFDEVAEFGRGLLWLHTFGERFVEGRTAILIPSLVVKGELHASR